MSDCCEEKDDFLLNDIKIMLKNLQELKEHMQLAEEHLSFVKCRINTLQDEVIEMQVVCRERGH